MRIQKIVLYLPINNSLINYSNDMTTAQQKAAKVLAGYNVWYTLSPMERYEKVMIHFTAEERKGVAGMRRMAQYIIDNNISK